MLGEISLASRTKSGISEQSFVVQIILTTIELRQNEVHTLGSNAQDP